MDWLKKLNEDPMPWLLDGNPWTRYRTLTHLMDLPLEDSRVREAYEQLIRHPLIEDLLNRTLEWFPRSITRHNKPELSHYQLTALAEMGVRHDHPKMRKIIDRAVKHKTGDFFAVRQILPVKGEPMGKADPDAREWHAMPCDSPLITYALLLAGEQNHRVIHSVNEIEQKWTYPKGWFCHFFFVEGQFRRHNMGCPMAGLMALQVFSMFPEMHNNDCVKNAVAPIRYHKELGKSFYFFGRSKKFWTFKYPFVWYNALYLANVLSRFKSFRNDPLMLELIDWILSSQDESGRFRPTSIYRCYSDWDFANKKESSPWITYLCCRILKQLGG
jgi:hypothetical protein